LFKPLTLYLIEQNIPVCKNDWGGTKSIRSSFLALWRILRANTYYTHYTTLIKVKVDCRLSKLPIEIKKKIEKKVKFLKKF